MLRFTVIRRDKTGEARVRALVLALEQVRALAPKSTPTRRKGKAGADLLQIICFTPVVFGIGILHFVFYRQEDLDLLYSIRNRGAKSQLCLITDPGERRF